MTLASSALATGFRDTFDSGRAGWLDGWEDVPADWFPVGGHPGGHIVTPDDQFDRAAGETDRWGGDRSNAFGGVLSFDARFDVGNSGEVYAGFRSPGVPAGANFHFAERSGGPWRHYVVPLRASTPGWDATQSELITALGALELVVIGVNDAGDLYLDNVVFASKVKRRLGIAYDDGAFHGKLRPRGGCAKRQKVIVYRKHGGPDRRVGRDRTSGAGKYSVREAHPRRGMYYARTAAHFEARAGKCLAAKSKATAIGRPD